MDGPDLYRKHGELIFKNVNYSSHCVKFCSQKHPYVLVEGENSFFWEWFSEAEPKILYLVGIY